MIDNGYIEEIASMIAVGEYGDTPMSRDQEVLDRLRSIAAYTVLRTHVKTLVYVRRNLEAFAIAQGYEAGEENISFEMVFRYLDFETDMIVNALVEGS